MKRRIAGGALAIAIGITAAWEGLRTDAYPDAIGKPTICYGSTKGVRIGDTATKEQCDALLEEEVTGFMYDVQRNITVRISDKETAAYTSFAYNVGLGNFKRSTLLKKLNAGDRVGACNELPRWTRAGGVVLRGLVRRREHERKLCLEGWVPIPKEKPLWAF